MRTNLMTASLTALAMTACSLHQKTEPTLRIDRITPDSVVMAPGAVMEIVVRGRGFEPGTPGRNTIVFGTQTLTRVPANADGTEIRFVVPESMPVTGEAAPRPLEAGAYPVSVKTESGESNHAPLRVFR
jgi:hypothetical protein